MNKPFAPKPAPISYAEGPRLQRAVQSLPFDDQVRFIALYKAHLESPKIKSLQRRGQFLYMTLSDGKVDKADVYDFKVDSHAQRCLSALTDCLRSQRAAVQVLMPVSPPVEKPSKVTAAKGKPAKAAKGTSTKATSTKATSAKGMSAKMA